MNAAQTDGEKPAKAVRIPRRRCPVCEMNRFIKSVLATKKHMVTVVVVGSLSLLSGCAPIGAKPTPEAAKTFLKLRGYNFDEKSFMAAAAANDVLAVNAFLAAGIDQDTKDEISGETAMIAAAARGDLAIVKTLLQGGADVNRKDKAGSTALLRALEYKNEEVANAILSQKGLD